MENQCKSVCFCDNGPCGDAYAKAFSEIVKKAGFTSVYYTGAGTNVRSSSLDGKLRDDFYNAEVVIVRLAGAEPLDNWAVPELRASSMLQSGTTYFIYADGLNDDAVDLLTAEQIGPIKRINGTMDFSRQLEADLRTVSGSQ